MWKFGIVLAVASAMSVEAAGQKCGVSSTPSLGIVETSVFPFVGLVYYQQGDKAPEPLAMATLIDSQHVLVPVYVTKAPVKQNLKYIQFDAVDVENTLSAQNYSVERIYHHPDYKTAGVRSQNDIAVIRLQQPVPLSDTVTPACLPVKGQSYDADEYRFVSYNTGTPPAHEDAKGRKHVSLLPRITSDVCQQQYSSHGSIINAENIAEYICAGDKENDSCRGDAGSPLLHNSGEGWTAVAISLFGPRICKTGVATAFLNVQPYVEWIQSVIANKA